MDKPEYVKLEIENSKTQENKIIRVKIQYDGLPSYCMRCKLQGHNEDDCRILHPKLQKMRINQKKSIAGGCFG